MSKPKYSLVTNKTTGEKGVRINKTMEVVKESVNPELYKNLRTRALNNLKQRAFNGAMSSVGLTRVRGALGGVYWE